MLPRGALRTREALMLLPVFRLLRSAAMLTPYLYAALLMLLMPPAYAIISPYAILRYLLFITLD